MRFLIALLLLASFTAAADESSVYESVDDISIGRVFLTPGERRWLDANRHLTSQVATAGPAAVVESEDDDTPDAEPAGFIINSSGRAVRYRNGDFAPSAVPPSTMRFPDDVEIRRHEPAPETEARDLNDGPDDETADD